MLKEAVAVFSEMGHKTSKDAPLGIYKTDLEKALVKASKEYYAGKARLWLAEETCPEFLIKVSLYIDSCHR